MLVSDKSPARLAYSRQLGADLAVDVTRRRLPVRQCSRPPAGEGPTWSWRPSAAARRSRRAWNSPRRGATLVWFGLPEGAGHYPFSFQEFFRRGLTAYSNFGAQGEPGLESFRYAVRLITDGAIDVTPLLTHMLPIENVDEAFRIARDRTDNALKVSIKF